MTIQRTIHNYHFFKFYSPCALEVASLGGKTTCFVASSTRISLGSNIVVPKSYLSFLFVSFEPKKSI